MAVVGLDENPDRRLPLSVVATLYQSEAHLDEFVARASAAAAQVAERYEIILVNDGSPDGSMDRALALRQADPRIKVVDLSRNFGHHHAIMVGLTYSVGDHVFLIDCDLEEPPECLADFSEAMKDPTVDVAYGVQTHRKGGVSEKVTGTAFYALFNALSTHKVPANFITARLMTRNYVNALIAHDERELFLGGLLVAAGFEQRPVPVEKTSASRSTYSLGHKMALFVNSVTSFSSLPLVWVFYLGTTVSVFGGLCAGYVLVRKLFWADYDMGWPSLIVSIWLVGGLTIFSIGLVGIYLSKVFSESKARPTVVRRVHATLAGP